MSSHYAKPENALRKGQDLVKVGKPSSALKTLSSILVSRRYRQWTPTHEKVMFFYIELAVDLKRNVKDAFVQYRIICQQVQSASLEKSLRYYQKLAEEKANDAAAKAAKAAEQAGIKSDVVKSIGSFDDDLEEESPESIMLAAMSGEGTKERLDRQILTPAVKYLWECYRTTLDVLRNNAKLELLYHQTARAAFDFCKRFERSMEFRRLCEILRNHLVAIAKFQNQPSSIDLNSAETQKLYLETRFQQLKMAADLELWQEAYRTIEDIHENMRLGTKNEPPPELMKTYYEKLSQIFWASSNYLFHAYSLHKCYLLSAQEATGAPAAATALVPSSKEVRSKLASSVVLSALIISGSNQSFDMHDVDGISGVEHEGNMRLAQLLGFKKESPSRQRILYAVQQTGVLDDANELSKTIFRLLENQFGPLSLYQQLKPLFAQLKEDPELAKYVTPLESLTVVRVLQQLSTVFKSMKIDKFIPLVPDVGSIFALERMIMNGITSDLIQLRFDHRNMTLIFPEADLEQPKLRDQLVNVSKNIISIAHSLEAQQKDQQVQQKKLQERIHVFKLIKENLVEEHENVFLRQELIEKRKQELEKILAEKERRALEQKAAERRAREAEEQRRLRDEQERREEERRKKENSERELRAKQQLAEEMRKKLDAVTASTNLSTAKAEKKIQALTQDLENIDKIQLMRAQEEILKAQQREIERRRKESSRRIDYTVRAIRLEEREQLLTKMDSQRQEEKEQFLADFAKYLEADKAAHTKALAEQTRLIGRMSKEKSIFHEKLMQRRTEAFLIEKKKQDDRLAILAEKKRIAEERRRKEEEIREKERAAQAERDRKQREEEERQEAERAAIAKKKEEERQAVLAKQREEKEKQNEIVQARLRREEEAEQKVKERRAAAAAGGRPSSTQGWGRPGAGSNAPSSGDSGRDDFRREDRPSGGDIRRRDDDNRDSREFRRDNAPREERPREEKPERDLADFRTRPAAQQNNDEQPRESRWGNGPRRDDSRQDPRQDRPSRFASDRQGGDDRQDNRQDNRPDNRQDRPSRFASDAPRDTDRQDRPSRFASDRQGGDDRRGDERSSGNFRRDDNRQDNRQERDTPSRDNFGSRSSGPRQSGGGDRDWGAMRKSQGGNDAPREDRDFRRNDAPAAASSSSSAASSAPAKESAKQDAQPDDGFTTVARGSRR